MIWFWIGTGLAAGVLTAWTVKLSERPGAARWVRKIILAPIIVWSATTIGSALLIYKAFHDFGYECIITCGTEEHAERDPHTNGYAVDLRAWHVKTEDEKRQIRDRLKEYLGSDYYVSYEKPGRVGQHFHVQVNKSLWPYLMEHDP